MMVEGAENIRRQSDPDHRISQVDNKWKDPKARNRLEEKKIESHLRSSARGENGSVLDREYSSGRGFRWLGFIRRGKKMRENGSTECKNNPLDDAGLISFVTYSWISKYMYNAYKNGFDGEKWPSLSPREGCEGNADRLDMIWMDELSRRGAKNASFQEVVWQFVRKRVIASSITFTCYIVCGFVSQTLMRELIVYVESVEGNDHVEGIKWAMLLILVESVRLLCLAWTWALNYRTAMRLKLACMTMLYRKVIGLNDLGTTSTGELINLFANDSQRIFDLLLYGPLVIGGPIMTVGGICYILFFLGPMALLGMLVFIIFVPTQYVISRLAGFIRSKTVNVSDMRIRLTNEILDCIKLIKMYAWEKRFSENLLDIRKKELNLVLATNYCHSFSAALSPTVPFMASIVTFLAHISTGENLTAAQAFPITTFFASQMTPNLIRMKAGFQALIDSSVAFNRLKKVLLIECESCIVKKPIVENQAIAIRGGTFSHHVAMRENGSINGRLDRKRKNITTKFKGKNHNQRKKGRAEPIIERADSLFDITFEATKGKLIGICGQVGSGKSSLLLAALGQLRATKGQVMRDGSCAYVSQQAWIVNATLKDNILFGEPFDAERYSRALHVCNLIYDIETMPGGDQTEIGERGVNLSGGQKQRVALARALYADRDIYFLDDPLSAVDAHVGLHIFHHLITGALRGKTVLFVTHQIQYLNRCDDVYMMRDGRIVEHGTHDDLVKMDQEYACMVKAIAAENERIVTTVSVESNTTTLDEFGKLTSNDIHEPFRFESTTSFVGTQENDSIDKLQPTLTEGEKSEEGEVKGLTYCSYIVAAGGWISACLVFFLTFVSVGTSSFSTWWLARWLKAGGANKTDPETGSIVHSENITDNPDSSFYQTIYGATIGIILATNLLRSFAFCQSAIKASFNFHDGLFNRIINSPMRFFDTTPTGRIQNLFSRDMDEVDMRLPMTINNIIQNILSVFFAILNICIIFPLFMSLICIIGVIYYFISRIYRISLRGLKRLESTSRSPLLSHVTATVQGLNTIHAFGKDGEFKLKFSKLVEENNAYLFMGCAAMKWLAVRIDSLAILMTCTTAFLVVILKGQVSPAWAGLALTCSVHISGFLQFTIRLMSEAETQFISVERINQYINLPETEGNTSEEASTEVKPDWPRTPTLKFEDVHMSYGKDTPLVLRETSFVAEPREKIGIVGRTGSGKSSLAVALFRLVELSAGKITIDDVDVSKVGLDQLRKRLSIIPQDPILFSGTIRSNLDPFKTNSDVEIWEALEKTKLKDRVKTITGQLDATVSFGGDNFSVGERQLLCLARALLRHTKILVLDEATAAVDPETETAIQNTIQRVFVDSTVLTIAHRLQTVLSSDRILVMEEGKVSEFDTPSNLLANENSKFSVLLKAAEKSREKPVNLDPTKSHL